MPLVINKKRTTLSLPADASDEEIIESIARTMGIPREKVPPFNKTEWMAAIKSHRDEVTAIKSAYQALLDGLPNTQPSKYEELDDVARFLYAANHTPPIASSFGLPVPNSLPRFPDFTLLYQDKKIGLEHTRLLDSDLKALNVIIRHCLERAECLISGEYPDLSKSVTVFFDYSQELDGIGSLHGRNLSRTEKERLADLIVDSIRLELSGSTAPKPGFIRLVNIVPNNDSRFDVGLGESYETRFDFRDILTSLIRKKESRAADYRGAAPVDLLWLLIVVDDLNLYSGFNLEGPFFPSISSSEFDCIIMFEKFGGSIVPLFLKQG